MSVTTTIVQKPTRVLARAQLHHPKPLFHLTPPQGWINDPCAPGFDVATSTYHLSYQWNPYSVEWGNISWGHASSTDGLRWKNSSTQPTMIPDQAYDKEGVFTGCSWPTGLHGEKGVLTAFYSSITALPHWTWEHKQDSEGVSVATSLDGGKTWRKSLENPVLQGEPDGLKVTGFRDPFLSYWPALDQALGTEKRLYAALSGGIVGQGPNVFLYSVNPDDLTSWNYLGPLVDITANTRTGGRWTGELGVNWECVNFMTLSDGADAKREVLLLGAESKHIIDFRQGQGDEHSGWPLWVAGSIETTPIGPRLRHEFDGYLDHGCLYAPNSFEHPVTQKRVAFGWIKEEELTLSRRAAKGWTGFLSMPRELSLHTTRNVTRGLNSSVESNGSMIIVEDGPCGKIVQTLGIRPYQDFRAQPQVHFEEWSNLKDVNGKTARVLTSETISSSWELEATIAVDPSHQRVGFNINSTEDGMRGTTIYFDIQNEQIVVDRSLSNREADIKKYNMSGAFTLYYRRTDSSATEELEKMRMRIFRDGDTLELFVNDRFALTSTVYAGNDSYAGICYFAEGGSAKTIAFEKLQLWQLTDKPDDGPQ
ncbi:hypothetical protein OPT61_g3712 [Boeremia exigua]|uniref:Uncharacterized protein n=1 Tax=Boeremia exigua TaxID=749465 RepID=A0ACC2IGY2_9PLEO|nr:hypothetical protein OPT61_g3712 [Boeremia exigua]